MYAICRCPDCGKTFIAKISIDCLEKQLLETEDAKRYVLENVTITTTYCDVNVIPNLRTVLKSSIQDEEIYNRVITNIRAVFGEYL